MIRQPRLKNCFTYHVLPQEGVFLQSAMETAFLRGRAYERLIPCLTGDYREAQLIEKLGAEIPATELYYALGILERDGYITTSPQSRLPLEEQIFWESANIDLAGVNKQHSIRLIVLDDINTGTLTAALSSRGIEVTDNADYKLVVCGDYLNPALKKINRDALASKKPWLLFKPTGPDVWLGPIFNPNSTGCWHCLENRLRAQRKVDAYLRAKDASYKPSPPPIAALPATWDLAHALAVGEIEKWLIGRTHPQLEGAMMSWHAITLRQQWHQLTRRPQCSECGDETPRKPQPFIYRTEEIRSLAGGYRTATPEQTYARLRDHVSPITGIVGALDTITISSNDDNAGVSFVADHNFALIEEDLYFTRETLRGRAGGKGKRPFDARLGAICEAIERYAGVCQGNEPTRVSSYADLGTDGIHPNDCMLFSEHQLSSRAKKNQTYSRFNWIPERFDEQAVISWAPLWSLTDGRWRYIPMSYCYYGYARDHNEWFARADANGCAAGNTHAEAITQGFLELIERDSVALWWYNRLQLPEVDLQSFNDPYIEQLIATYKTLGRDLWVLDIGNDFGIPTFAAITREIGKSVENIMFGFGSHFDPHVALIRALTELNQLLPWTGRAPRYREDMNEMAQWWQEATLANQPFLRPLTALPRKTSDDYRTPPPSDLQAAVEKCVALTRNRGLELLVLDQTRPDIDLKVVKVIVPGLRHFWARFGNGRLFDIPVKMGRLSTANTEETLNPYPMFL